jgi:hypothetical protein
VVPQDQETTNLALQDSREEAAALHDALAAAEERQGQLEGHLRRRRAALRWRYAAAAALLPAAARAEAVQRWECWARRGGHACLACSKRGFF